MNIPLPELRTRLDELPRDREILVFCRSGQRAYYATRILAAKRLSLPQHCRGHVVSLAHRVDLLKEREPLLK